MLATRFTSALVKNSAARRGFVSKTQVARGGAAGHDEEHHDHAVRN